MALTLAEQEFHIHITADDPNTVHAYSDYPKWQRKLERIGATLVREEVGGGRHYELSIKQLSLRKLREPRTLTEEQRSELAKRLAEARKSQK